MSTADAEGRTSFEALIVPHRSLSRAGLRWVVASLLVLSLVISIALWWLGAWPVIGFIGLEALLAIWLVHRNATGAKASELLLLSDSGLLVVRTDPSGRRSERRLDGCWLRARLEEQPGRPLALMLQNRGERLEVGAALGEIEKRQLAAALQEAIHRQRNPVFDNPQLRG
ncbi:MAG: DUF2244 domain-containing protein [Acetobacteraceae bacterium]|nr:DUF2244 domain-containing protein [Acetobacteraceae bacterium]